jgi:hypothetical protein
MSITQIRCIAYHCVVLLTYCMPFSARYAVSVTECTVLLSIHSLCIGVWLFVGGGLGCCIFCLMVCI